MCNAEWAAAAEAAREKQGLLKIELSIGWRHHRELLQPFPLSFAFRDLPVAKSHNFSCCDCSQSTAQTLLGGASNNFGVADLCGILHRIFSPSLECSSTAAAIIST